MKVVSLFSGAGGLDLGFKKAGFDIVWANEFDKFAGETYSLNFGKNHLVIDDISKVDVRKIPKADVVIGGFPCQPFSIAGYRKGFEDERGELFWQIIRVAKEIKPKIIVLENVKNLLSHDSGKTFATIVETLKSHGYNVKHKVISSYDFGLPQGRERIFLVAINDKNMFNNFEFPISKSNKKNNFRSIKFEDNVDDKYFYLTGKYSEMLKNEPHDTVLQIRRHYVRKNAKQIFPTLTANMGTGGHNVPIIFDDKKNAFRKITPKEAFLVQGFPHNFKLPDKMSDAKLYKQAGNAVSVAVSEAVAKKIWEVLNA